jgi:hypothetical protein
LVDRVAGQTFSLNDAESGIGHVTGAVPDELTEICEGPEKEAYWNRRIAARSGYFFLKKRQDDREIGLNESR